VTDFKATVLDLSHHQVGPSGRQNDPIDFEAVAAFGVKAVILKASQGVGMVDKTYADRRKAALDADLLVGAYHFATNDDVDAQVAHFLECAQPSARTLMALDHEPNNGDELDLHGAQAFLESLTDQLGRKPIIYGGSLLKEQTAQDDSLNDFFAGYRLWLSQYGPHAVMPDPWDDYWLWQFSGDGTNSNGIVVPGIYKGGTLDMNYFKGTDEELAAQWA
jgi:lysozyme